MVLRTDIKTEVLMNLYDAGYSASELSKKFNTTPKMIIDRLKNSGVITRTMNNYNTDRLSRVLSDNQRGENNTNWNNGSSKLFGICECCGKKFVTNKCGRDIVRFCSNKCAHIVMESPMKGLTGKNNPNWKENKKKAFRKSLRDLDIYKLWRDKIFERDDFTCKDCGYRGGYIEAHHITPFAEILNKHKILTYDNAYDCEELWNVDNGITYCLKCHTKNDKNRNVDTRRWLKRLI